MKNSFKGWVQFLCIGLMFFSVSFVANASTIDDPYITSVSVTDRTETATSATNVTYEISFVTSHAISTGEYIHISSRPTACSEQTYDNCLMNFDSVTITGISGDVTYGAYGYLSFVTSANFAAGTHTITLQHVKHPIVAGSQRFLVSTSAHGMQPSSNDDTYGTPSDPVVIGSPLVTGAVTDASNNPVSSGWAQVYKEDWSLSAGFGIDEWGAYAVANPGFVNGDIVHISVYPDASTGLFTTHDSFTYNGTTATKDIVLQEATKTITGTVTYEDTGDPVTSASVNVNGGSTWAGTNPDENGLYSMKITGGDYEVCLGDQWNENGRVAKDWYLQGDGQCQHVLFASDTSEEIETLNFEVKRADAHVVGVIKNPDGSYPENGGWVSFSTKDGMWFGSDVNSETGEFDVALVGGTSEITATSLSARAVGSTTYQVQYSAHSQDEHTFWDESTVTVNADETKNLGTIILSERDVVYTATVVDTDGNPVPNIHVNAWQEQGGWTDATTNDSGVASLYLYAGSWFIRPSIWGDVASEYIYAGMDEKVTFASGDTGNGTFILTRTTLTVTANARAEDGSLAAVNGWANCWSNDGYGFGGQIQYGTGTFGAVGGDYHCNLWMEDQTYQAAGEQQYTFTDGENETIEFTLLERTATATIYIKDQDNNLITASNARATANSMDMGHIDSPVQNGVATIRLAPGTYNFGVWFEGQSNYISVWGGGPEAGITVVDGDSVTHTITVYEISGTLTATLKDTEGAPVANAHVHCGNWPELEGKVLGDFDGGKVIENGSQSGADGVAVVGLVTNHEYECWVGMPSSKSNLIGPAATRIDLTKEDNVSQTFIFQESNATISGTVSFEEGSGKTADDMNMLWCNGWADEGYNSFSDSFSNTYSLNALKGTWHVFCGTDIMNQDGSRSWFSTQWDTTVNVTGAGSYTQNLTLQESFFMIPESFSETFDATQPKNIVLPDGSKINIPANALATSGNVTITADPELKTVKTYTDAPFGFPWNFEAYDGSNVLISGNFNNDITLIAPYNQEALDALGIDETTILPKYYDDETGAWQNTNNAAQDIDANTITFTLSHFSQVGLVYNQRLANAQGEKPKKPRSLKAKKVTRTSALLTWKKPTGDTTVTKYKVQLRKYKVKKQKRWNKYNNVELKKKAVKKLKANTRYQFRIKACNTVGCSKFTKWKAFKTKVKA